MFILFVIMREIIPDQKIRHFGFNQSFIHVREYFVIDLTEREDKVAEERNDCHLNNELSRHRTK